jgi:UbiD family decarboxylase
MSLRTFLDQAQESGDLITVEKPVSVEFELANVAHALDSQVVLFDQVKEHPGWRVVAGPCLTAHPGQWPVPGCSRSRG